MENRKRKSALENYIDGLLDPPEKQKRMTEFYNSLRIFYKRRWNAPLRLPHVQGVEVNLFRLYDTVMSLGGWQKVAVSDRWSDVAESLGCKDDIVCGDHAIKLIYMRYLSKFEQVETIGDVDDYVDNEMSRNRGRGATSFFATNDCPISYSRLQEYVPRDERGNIINEPDYSRLTKSLLSGLPNEIDFAVNICMLLSHAGPKQLRICYAPTLLTLLVAHTGVYDENDPSIKQLAEKWKETTSHDFQSFWITAGIPQEMMEQFMGKELASKTMDEDAQFFTALTSSYNVKDPKSWRLNQVSTIIRNLSFEPANRVTIVKTWPVMKFLILCASCRYPPLYTAAYDALSNLSTDIDLADRTMIHIAHHSILRTIQEGIFSNDKFKLIRSLEMLTGLSALEGNETTVCEWLRLDAVSHIFNVVGIKDIMLCVYTLECLYQLSEMGSAACDVIADCPNAIQQLVSMITLEAVSFGPAGLAGMKVVEYQPQFSHHPPQQQHHLQQQPQQHQQQQQIQHQQPQFVPQRVQNPPQQQIVQTQPPQMTVRQAIQSGLHQSLQQQHQNLQHHHQQQSAQHQPPPAVKQQVLGATIQVQPIVPSTNPGESQVEKLTEKWIKQNCVFEPTMTTPRGELYAAYVDDLRNQYHSLSGSLAMFSGVMKNLYPDVNFRMAENGIMIVAQGIRLVRPHRLAPAASQSAAETTHPLMKKMLEKDRPIVNGVNGHSNSNSRKDAESEVPKNGGKMPNGHIEVHQEVVSAAEIYDENTIANGAEFSIEKCDKMKRLSGEIDTRTNGQMVNGVMKQKRISIADRAASVIAVAQMKGYVVDDKREAVNEDRISPVENGATENECKPTTSGEEAEPQKVDASRKRMPTASSKTDYMCEWDGCSLYYPSPSHVLHHLAEEHVVEELRLLCRWNTCNDPTPRNRWSLITHIQDAHCTEAHLKKAAQKRLQMGGIVVPRAMTRTEIVPRDISNHPGYAKNAAMDAIRRHAFNFLPREITDEAEGPVTKSIRLTSSLILRNLARYSSEGRQKLRRHESHLCWLALSRLESSQALSQLLAELHQMPSSEEEMTGLSTVPSTASMSSNSNSMQMIQTAESPCSSTSTAVRSIARETSKPIAVPNNSGSPSKVISFPKMTTHSNEMPPPNLPFSPSRISGLQHLPTQPSPLVQTTPVRAGAGH